MTVNVTRNEAVARARSALGRLGLPQPWARFLKRDHYRDDNDPNDCSFFATWCLKDNGGRDRSDYRNGSIKALRADHAGHSWAARTFESGGKGDLILLRWGSAGLPDHVGIVTGRNRDGSYNTIEANTGPRVGVLNPAGVYERTRFPANIVGFLHPDYQGE